MGLLKLKGLSVAAVATLYVSAFAAGGVGAYAVHNYVQNNKTSTAASDLYVLDGGVMRLSEDGGDTFQDFEATALPLFFTDADGHVVNELENVAYEPGPRPSEPTVTYGAGLADLSLGAGEGEGGGDTDGLTPLTIMGTGFESGEVVNLQVAGEVQSVNAGAVLSDDAEGTDLTLDNGKQLLTVTADSSGNFQVTLWYETNGLFDIFGFDDDGNRLEDRMFGVSFEVGVAKAPDATPPGGDNPGGDNPGGDNPGGDNPGGDNPGGDNPGGDNPGGDNPGGDNPGGDNPGGDNPGGDNPGGDNPGGDNPGGDNPGGDNPANETDDPVCVVWDKGDGDFEWTEGYEQSDLNEDDTTPGDGDGGEGAGSGLWSMQPDADGVVRNWWPDELPDGWAQATNTSASAQDTSYENGHNPSAGAPDSNRPPQQPTNNVPTPVNTGGPSGTAHRTGESHHPQPQRDDFQELPDFQTATLSSYLPLNSGAHIVVADSSDCFPEGVSDYQIGGCVNPNTDPNAIVFVVGSKVDVRIPHLKSIVLHEFAHVLQFRWYFDTDIAFDGSKYEALEDPVGSVPVSQKEYVAECMAFDLGATGAKPGGYLTRDACVDSTYRDIGQHILTTMWN